MLSSGVKNVFLCLCCVTAFNLAEGTAGYELPWGRDSDLIEQPASLIPPLPNKKDSFGTRIAEKVIWVHTDIISTTRRKVIANMKDGSEVLIYENGQFVL